MHKATVSSSVRQGYALTEQDSATGLDHIWFRKNENQAGRWTSPDPYNGSMSLGDPQSFNRYSYVENDPVNWVDPSGLNMAGPNTRYGPLDPMGVAYYVDGMLTTANHAWSILGMGAGYIDFADVAGITVINSWEERLHGRIGPDGRPTEGSWIEYRNFTQTVHIWGGSHLPGGATGSLLPEYAPAPNGSERLERLMNCALGYYGIDPISVLGLSSNVKWALIALAAGGIPKSAAAKLGLRVFRQPGSSGYTSALRMLSSATGDSTLKALANLGKKWAGPIAIASAVIDAAAIGICTALD